MERTSQQEELCNSDTLPTEAQHNEMSSRPASSSSSLDSLYAPPSPPTPHRVAQATTPERYTSFRDVPHLSLNNSRAAIDPLAYLDAKHGIPESPKTPPPSLPPPVSYCYQRPPGLTHPLPDPVPRGLLRVVNRDPPALDDSSSISTDGQMKYRPRPKSTRGKIDFTDPYAEKKDKQKAGLAKIQAALSEKRKFDGDVQIVARKLETASKKEKPQNSGGLVPTMEKSRHIKEPEKHEGRRYPSSQPARLDKQSMHTKPMFSNSPPKGKVWTTNSLRLPGCDICQRGWDLGHVHSYEEQQLYKEWLKKQGEEEKDQNKKRSRADGEKLKRETETIWPWPDKIRFRDSVHSKSPVSIFIEDIAACRPRLSNPATHKKDTKIANSSFPLNPNQVQAAAEDKERERLRRRLQDIRKTAVASAHLSQDAQWDSIDLSGDDDWEKVADEGAEWEVLEK